MIAVSMGLYCHLQRPNVEDHAILVKWLNDPYLRNMVFDPGLFAGSSEEQAKKWIEGNAELFGADDIVLILRRNKDMSPIGLFLLKNIDWRNRTADVNYLIGDSEQRNSVFGPEMAVLGIYWAFFHLNLRKLYGYVLSRNSASRSLVEFGGRPEGILKNYFKTNVGWEDYVLYSILNHEFCEFVYSQKDRMLRRHFQLNLMSDDIFQHRCTVD